MKKLLLSLLALFLLTTPCALADVIFNLESGFYDEPVVLEMRSTLRSATIYYTLDGSTPTTNDLIYTGPITLGPSNEREDVLTQITGISTDAYILPTRDFPTGHVVRAATFSTSGQLSEVTSATYFVGYDREELYGDIGIMLLAIDPDALFDYDTGIYVLGKYYDEWLKTNPDEGERETANYSQRGREWERPVNVTWLPAGDEGVGFTMDMGMRIKGSYARQYAQKSLRLIARQDYGEKRLEYELYPDNIREKDGAIVNKYKSFTLRNGGNDIHHSRIRDPLIANLATGMSFETAQNMPCIAFINGEYWGLYTLNEEYTDNYIQYHYGLTNENIISVKSGEIDEGEESEIVLFNNLFDFITKNDMAKASNYAKACRELDMASFADYCALQIYINNEDGPFQQNNWQMWRTRVPDNAHPYGDCRWRMMLFDTDMSTGLYDRGTDYSQKMLSEVLTTKYEYPDSPYYDRLFVDLFRALMNNEDFRQLFIMACCDVRNLYFSPDRTFNMIEKMSDEYLPYIPDSIARYGNERVTGSVTAYIKSEMTAISTFIRGRHSVFLTDVQNCMGLDYPCTVGLEVNKQDKGAIYVNGRTLPLTSLTTCHYFSEYHITLTAVPAEGATFVGWDLVGANATISDEKAATITVTFDGSFMIEALFK